MERVSPSFIPVEPQKLVAGVKGEELRLKYYSQRDETSQWVTLKMADEKKTKVLSNLSRAQQEGLITLKRLGVTGALNDNGGIDVTNLNFFGLAKKAGMNYGDVIEQVKVANPDRLSARWFYLPAFALLLLVAFWQLKFDRQRV